jgi:probable F420-dependent oxidoreductase
MRLGIVLPQVGPCAGPDSLTRVATRAEELGFDSAWVTERLLVPVAPSAPYPVADGRIPEEYKTSLDPLDALTFVAGQTSKISLGTSILNLAWYNPVLLARRLTTLDVLSKGRLRVGFGMGWSPEEYEAAGSSWATRGKRFEEALQVIKLIWTTDPVEFKGDFFSIPRSFIGPKPVQKPHPPVYMAAYTPAALARVARFADGWNPVGIPPAGVAQMFEGIKAAAQEAGRDPSKLELLMRANTEVTESALGDDRGTFCGTPEQIAADIAETREIGATELFFDPTFDPAVRSVDDLLERLKLFMQLAKESSRVTPVSSS